MNATITGILALQWKYLQGSAHIPEMFELYRKYWQSNLEIIGIGFTEA